MRLTALLSALIFLAVAAATAWALSPEEVIRLKKAGVSDAVIQKMLEQEKQGRTSQPSYEENQGEVVYRAGGNVQQEMQRNEEHERWKEEKSLDALKGVVIDTRTNPPLQ